MGEDGFGNKRGPLDRPLLPCIYQGAISEGFDGVDLGMLISTWLVIGTNELL